MSAPNTAGPLEAPLSAPKYGTLIPNRIFVGGIRYVCYQYYVLDEYYINN